MKLRSAAHPWVLTEHCRAVLVCMYVRVVNLFAAIDYSIHGVRSIVMSRTSYSYELFVRVKNSC